MTNADLQTVIDAYEEAGRQMATLPDADRRRMIGAMVKALGRHCPLAVADLAGASAFAVLRVGGAQ